MVLIERRHTRTKSHGSDGRPKLHPSAMVLHADQTKPAVHSSMRWSQDVNGRLSPLSLSMRNTGIPSCRRPNAVTA